MERISATIDQPTDEYDKEMTQAQADAVALADVLLELKPEESPLTFVDVVLQGDSQEMLQDLQTGPVGELLAAPHEQLAMESDGSYYPILDLRKEVATFRGLSLRVYGWDTEKFRYTCDPRTSQPPYGYKNYPGEIDKSRQIEIGMSYQIGNQSFSETITLSASTTREPRLSRHIWTAAYAETGYEGHDGKGMGATDSATSWMLDFVAKNVGDEPKSVNMLIDEKIDDIRSTAERHGLRGDVDALISVTWPAQALYLMKRRADRLGGRSIVEVLESEDDVKALVDECFKLLMKQYDYKSSNR